MNYRKTALFFLILFLLGIRVQAAAQNSVADRLAGFTESDLPLARVTIAIIDTGISTERLDPMRIQSGINYVSDDEGDRVGHGTHIASLILGAQDGTDSIAALAPNAVLVPLTYYSRYPSGVPINGGVEAMVRGIHDAIDVYAADIIVISSGTDIAFDTLRDAIAYAEESGTVVISAVGNDGNDRLLYPAAYDTVIGVGAVDQNGTRSDFSQTSSAITLCAPGEELWAVSIKNGRFFETVSGTSYACAYAAAAAAVLRGIDPTLSPHALRNLLYDTCTDLGAEGYDTESGFGLLNLDAARNALVAAMTDTDCTRYDTERIAVDLIGMLYPFLSVPLTPGEQAALFCESHTRLLPWMLANRN